MKNMLVVLAVIIGLGFLVVSVTTSRWNEGQSPAWTRYIPEIRICHLGGIPPVGGTHCHWFWETPHDHPV